MNTNAQVLQNYTSASRTHLAGVSGIYRHYLNPGLDSLVVEHCSEHSQTNVVSRTGKVTILEHKFERQIFQNNCAIGVHQRVSNLMPPITTLVGNMFVQAGNLLNGSSAVLSALLLPGKRTLKNSKFIERCLQVFRTIKSRSIRKRKGMSDAYINANGEVSRHLYRLFSKFNLKQDVPTRRLTHYDNILEYAFRKLSMPTDLDQSNVLDIQTLFLDLGPIARLVVYTRKVGYLLKSWSTSFTFQELVIGTIQAAKYLLSSRHIEQAERVVSRFFVAPVSPHSSLLVIPNRPATFVPPLTPIFKRTIVQPASRPQNVVECGLLFLGWIQTVAIGFDHLTTSLLRLDISPDRFDRHITGSPYIVGSCPHTWQSTFEFRELFAQFMSSKTFEPMHYLVRGKRRRERAKHVNVVGLHGNIVNLASKFTRLLAKQFNQPFNNLANQNRTAIFGYPHEMIIHVVGCMSSSFTFHKLIITQKGVGRNSSSPLKGGVPLR
jgi:hypothetical protein